jgi:hypothetical protein
MPTYFFLVGGCARHLQNPATKCDLPIGWLVVVFMRDVYFVLFSSRLLLLKLPSWPILLLRVCPPRCSYVSLHLRNNDRTRRDPRECGRIRHIVVLPFDKISLFTQVGIITNIHI